MLTRNHHSICFHIEKVEFFAELVNQKTEEASTKFLKKFIHVFMKICHRNLQTISLYKFATKS